MKKIGLILLALAMMFSLAGCQKSTPEETVKNYLGIQKNHLRDEIEEDMSNSELNDAELIEILREMMCDFDYTIGETVMNGDDKATVSVTIKTYAIGQAFSDAMTKMLSEAFSLLTAESGENALIDKVVEYWKEALVSTKAAGKTFEVELKIPVVKENGEWKVLEEPEDLADAIFGGLGAAADSLINGN